MRRYARTDLNWKKADRVGYEILSHGNTCSKGINVEDHLPFKTSVRGRECVCG